MKENGSRKREVWSRKRKGKGKKEKGKKEDGKGKREEGRGKWTHTNTHTQSEAGNGRQRRCCRQSERKCNKLTRPEYKNDWKSKEEESEYIHFFCVRCWHSKNKTKSAQTRNTAGYRGEVSSEQQVNRHLVELKQRSADISRR